MEYNSNMTTTKVDTKTYKKINFIYNALEKGWSIKKEDDCLYI